MLARRGVRPDRFQEDSEILAAVLAADERDLRYGSNLSLPTLLHLGASGGCEDGELGYEDESRRRIEEWLQTVPESALREADQPPESR